MAKTAAYQLAGTNIRVNTICPGLIEVRRHQFLTNFLVSVTHDLFADWNDSEDFDAARQRGTAGKIGQLNPLLRYGVAEEVCYLPLLQYRTPGTCTRASS